MPKTGSKECQSKKTVGGAVECCLPGMAAFAIRNSPELWLQTLDPHETGPAMGKKGDYRVLPLTAELLATHRV